MHKNIVGPTSLNLFGAKHNAKTGWSVICICINVDVSINIYVVSCSMSCIMAAT